MSKAAQLLGEKIKAKGHNYIGQFIEDYGDEAVLEMGTIAALAALSAATGGSASPTLVSYIARIASKYPKAGKILNFVKNALLYKKGRILSGGVRDLVGGLGGQIGAQELYRVALNDGRSLGPLEKFLIGVGGNILGRGLFNAGSSALTKNGIGNTYLDKEGKTIKKIIDEMGIDQSQLKQALSDLSDPSLQKFNLTTMQVLGKDGDNNVRYLEKFLDNNAFPNYKNAKDISKQTVLETAENNFGNTDKSSAGDFIKDYFSKRKGEFVNAQKEVGSKYSSLKDVALDKEFLTSLKKDIDAYALDENLDNALLSKIKALKQQIDRADNLYKLVNVRRTVDDTISYDGAIKTETSERVKSIIRRIIDDKIKQFPEAVDLDKEFAALKVSEKTALGGNKSIINKLINGKELESKTVDAILGSRNKEDIEKVANLLRENKDAYDAFKSSILGDVKQSDINKLSLKNDVRTNNLKTLLKPEDYATLEEIKAANEAIKASENVAVRGSDTNLNLSLNKDYKHLIKEDRIERAANLLRDKVGLPTKTAQRASTLENFGANPNYARDKIKQLLTKYDTSGKYLPLTRSVNLAARQGALEATTRYPQEQRKLEDEYQEFNKKFINSEKRDKKTNNMTRNEVMKTLGWEDFTDANR